MNSFYSRLGFKVIKYFPTSPIFVEAREQFHYESVKSKELYKQQIYLQCYLTIPRRVTILHGNRIELNEYRDLYKYLNEVTPSNYWFPYEYIDAEVNKKIDKTKGLLTGN